MDQLCSSFKIINDYPYAKFNSIQKVCNNIQPTPVMKRRYSLLELANIPGNRLEVLKELTVVCDLELSDNHSVRDYIYRLDSFYNGDNLVNLRCKQGYRYISAMPDPLNSTHVQIYNYIVENIDRVDDTAQQLRISKNSVRIWRKYKPVDETQWRPIKALPYIYVSRNGQIRNFFTGFSYTHVNPNEFHYVRVNDLRSSGWDPLKPKIERTLGINSIHIVVYTEVAKAFLPNPYNCTRVEHINKNKSDNSVENLRWIVRRKRKNPNKGIIFKRHKKFHCVSRNVF